VSQSEAVCPECGRRLALLKSGALPTHRDRRVGVPFRCPGTWWDPAALVAEMVAHGFDPHPDASSSAPAHTEEKGEGR
jgi:hypothetical protein